VSENCSMQVRSAPPSVYTFETAHEYRDGNLVVELGMERGTGRRHLRTPMPKRNGEWEEHYGIDVQEYETFVADAAEAHRSGGECRREDHLDRWMPWPGSPACERITFDRKRLARRRATAFVRILGNSVDPDGNVQVRLLGAGAVVVSIMPASWACPDPRYLLARLSCTT
jgi:hypothetical protein